MKYNIDIKKNLLGFKPETHWELIIAGTVIMTLCVIACNVYLYAYATQQIHMDVVVPVVSNDDGSGEVKKLKSLTSPAEMETVFSVYRNKSVTYAKLLNDLTKTNVHKIMTTASTSVATTTKIATSTK